MTVDVREIYLWEKEAEISRTNERIENTIDSNPGNGHIQSLRSHINMLQVGMDTYIKDNWEDLKIKGGG